MRDSLRRLALCLPLVPLALAFDPGQDDSPTPASPQRPIAEFGEVVIDASEYGEYLIETIGRRPLRSLILRKLVAQEAERLELTIDEAELDASLDTTWDQLVQRWRGDEQQAEQELRKQGFTLAAYFKLIKSNMRHQMLTDAICLATREISHDLAYEEFERRYGPGGVRVEVRHVFLDRRRVTSEVKDPTPGKVQAELERRIDVWLKSLTDGGDFAVLARDNSHDALTKDAGGVLTLQQQRAYGDRFIQALPTAAVGLPMGPVFSDRGAHLIEVTARETTPFEDVRDALKRELLAAPPTVQERREVEERLYAAANVKEH